MVTDDQAQAADELDELGGSWVDDLPDTLAFFEWSVDLLPDEVGSANLADPRLWAQANPALGVRIKASTVAKEQRALRGSPLAFARERLGVGEYPVGADGAWAVITEGQWKVLLAEDVKRKPRPVCWSLDMTPDQSSTALGMAGHGLGGARQVEHVKSFVGSMGVLAKLRRLEATFGRLPVALDPAGPASALLPELERAKVKVVLLDSAAAKQAASGFILAVREHTVQHIGQPVLNDAVRSATRRTVGDAWLWDRKGEASIAPLVAVTNALHVMGERPDYDVTASVH